MSVGLHLCAQTHNFLPQALAILLLPQYFFFFSAYVVINISNSTGEKQEGQGFFSPVAMVDHVICIDEDFLYLQARASLRVTLTQS